MIKIAAFVTALLASIGPTPAAARTDAKCLVSFVREDGTWSTPRRVDVEFYATRELLPGDREYPILAKIWFNPEDPPTVALDGTSLVTPEFYDSNLQRLFGDGRPRLGNEVDQPQRWRIEAVVNGRWVDTRYPAAFDPPAATPYEPAAHFQRSYIRGPNRICVYDRRGSPYIVTVDSGQPCP